MADEFSPDEPDQPVEVDLFGMEVVPIKDRRGRPSYKKDKENQSTVSVLRAAGWSQSRIARYLGCDEKTLRKHFSRELDFGADIVEAQCLEVLYAKMRQGHNKSANDLISRAEKGHALPPAPPKAEKETKLGKKAQADLDAQTGHEGTEWAGLLREPTETLN